MYVIELSMLLSLGVSFFFNFKKSIKILLILEGLFFCFLFMFMHSFFDFYSVATILVLSMFLVLDSVTNLVVFVASCRSHSDFMSLDN